MLSVVLDVSPMAKEVAFGVLLAGPGEVRMADVELEPVGEEVPTTGGAIPPRAPMNLDFLE